MERHNNNEGRTDLPGDYTYKVDNNWYAIDRVYAGEECFEGERFPTGITWEVWKISGKEYSSRVRYEFKTNSKKEALQLLTSMKTITIKKGEILNIEFEGTPPDTMRYIRFNDGSCMLNGLIREEYEAYWTTEMEIE